MEYDKNCLVTPPSMESQLGLITDSGSIIPGVPNLILAIIAAVLIILIVQMALRPVEKYGDRTDEIITALDVTMKEQGTIVDFKKAIGDPSFSPVKYIHLADLYRQGKATKEAVAKVLADNSL